MTTENSSMPPKDENEKPRGKPFTPGMSGNPAGRPKGSRNVATRAMEALLDGECEAIGRIPVEKAKRGEAIALRLCLERLLPPRRDRTVEFDLPTIDTAADAIKASDAVLAACANGILTPAEAQELQSLISTHVGIINSSQLEARISALEEGRS